MTSPWVRWLPAALSALTVLLVGCADGSARSEFLQEGRDLYVANGCSGCHGARGEGGVGLALAGVLETFPSCADHARWVNLGSERWKNEVGELYGASGKPITAVMPGFAQRLREDQILTLVAYERIEFAGADEATVREDCGI